MYTIHDVGDNKRNKQTVSQLLCYVWEYATELKQKEMQVLETENCREALFHCLQVFAFYFHLCICFHLVE